VDPNGDVGKTFRYRVRIKFLNPIFGAKAEQIDPKHPEEAWQVELPGAWSDPSKPVTIEPLVRFYFTGRLGERTNFVLFRWVYGVWHETRAEFTIGDSVVPLPDRNEAVEIPAAGGGRQKLTFSKPVSYNAMVTVVDAFDARIRHPDIERPTAKLVYYDQVTNKLGVRYSLIDTDDSVRFRNETRQPETGVPAPRQPKVGPGQPPVGPGPVQPPVGPGPREPFPEGPPQVPPERQLPPGMEFAPPPGQ